jgi:hypothetical protein
MCGVVAVGFRDLHHCVFACNASSAMSSRISVRDEDDPVGECPTCPPEPSQPHWFLPGKHMVQYKHMNSTYILVRQMQMLGRYDLLVTAS